MHIYSTKDYGYLILDCKNRPVDRKRVDLLKEAIQQNNALHLFPIIVNQQRHIVDGQHRYTAAKELGVEIYYIIGDVRPEDVAGFAFRTKKWSPIDYLDYWVAMGNDNYIRLKRLYEEYSIVDGKPFLTVPVSASLCSYGTHLGRHERFANGMWICNDEAWGRSTVRKVLDFRQYVSFWNNSIFVGAISNLCSNANYDHTRMMTKMQWLSTKLVKCPDTGSYIRVINEIYNFKQPDKARVELHHLSPSHKDYRPDKKRLDITKTLTQP